MVDSVITTKIIFDDKGRDDLKMAIDVLYEIDAAFRKAGTISEDDPDRQYIRGAIGVIDSILNGETF